MPDHVDRDTRSAIMAKVKSRDTKPEMQVRRALHQAGFRYRLHRADLPGCPDLVFPRHSMALFVHGCFWHWHGCTRSRMPKSNVSYWTKKISRNKNRDDLARSKLEKLGWSYRVIWECEISAGVERISTELTAASCPIRSRR